MPGSRSGMLRRGLPTVGLLCGLLAPAGANPIGPRADDEPEPIAGLVVDAEGGPRPGVQVRAIDQDWHETATVAEVETGPDGRFTVGGIRPEGPYARLPISGLLAVSPGGEIGWFRMWSWTREDEPIVITLRGPGSARGRLVDHEGGPIAGATIRPRTFGIPAADGGGSTEFTLVDRDLAGRFRATTDADGAFLLEGVPEGCSVGLVVEAPGLGPAWASCVAGSTTTIRLDPRAGVIRGRLELPEGVVEGGAIEATLAVSGRMQAAEGEEGGGGDEDASAFINRVVPIGPDGAFEVAGLPPGSYRLAPSFGGSAPLRASPVDGVVVQPGAEVDDLAIAVERLLSITGRVVSEDGEGIGGVSIDAQHIDTNRNSIDYTAHAETDADGRYTVPLPSGTVRISARQAPPEFFPEGRESNPKIEVEADGQWPDIVLARAASIEARVVTPGGEPVPDAAIHLAVLDPGGFASREAPVRTDAEGRARLRQLDPDDTLPLRARTPEATTDGALVVRPGEVEGILDLTISPDFVFRVAGLVADRSGKPIGGAKVAVAWSRNIVSEKTEIAGIGSIFETIETGPDGRFLSTALWPGDRYRVQVSADGFGDAESAEVDGLAGTEHDYGTIALIGQGGTIAGVVVDSTGAPVADAVVFNRGDGPAPVSSRTGPDGRFRLEGLFDGPKFVFARKQGHRFTALPIEGDEPGAEVSLTLLRLDEPPPAWDPGATSSYEEERAFAIEVLERLWDRYGDDPNRNGAFVCMLTMAKIDPEKALEWSAQHGGRYDSRLSRLAAEEIALTDPQTAMEILRGLPDDSSNRSSYQSIAEELAGSDPGAALPFAEEAAVLARGLDEPARTRALASAGEVLLRLGREVAGRRLLEEANDSAEQLAATDREGYARGSVAGSLAVVDADRAIALLEPFAEPNERTRYAGRIARAIAATDTERALELVEAMGTRTSDAATTRTEIAYRIGPDRPDEAIRILEGVDYSSSGAKYQAEGFAWLAVAVADRDPELSRSLIDRALAIIVDQPDRVSSFSYFGGPVASASWIAACAARSGYPDMDSVIARVLACREVERGWGQSMLNKSLSGGAAALCATAPGAARMVLRQLDARSGLSPVELGREANDHWLAAWGLADLDRARALVDAEMAALEGQDEVDLQRTGLFKLAEALGTPPDRRDAYLRQAIGATWYPGFGD